MALFKVIVYLLTILLTSTKWSIYTLLFLYFNVINHLEQLLKMPLNILHLQYSL